MFLLKDKKKKKNKTENMSVMFWLYVYKCVAHHFMKIFHVTASHTSTAAGDTDP